MKKIVTLDNVLKDLSLILNDLGIEGNFIIGVFGSVARGTNTKRSNMDIVFKEELDFVIAADIARRLRVIYKVHVDVCSYTAVGEEDKEIDEIALEVTGEPNEDSLFKTLNREVVWLDRRIY